MDGLCVFDWKFGSQKKCLNLAGALKLGSRRFEVCSICWASLGCQINASLAENENGRRSI